MVGISITNLRCRREIRDEGVKRNGMPMFWNGGRRVDAEGVKKELEAFIDLNRFLFERTAICYVGNHQATLHFPIELSNSFVYLMR